MAFSQNLRFESSVISYGSQTVLTREETYAWFESSVISYGWDFIKHNGAAAVIPVDEEGKLIMVSQYRNALDRYTLEIPAGGLNGPDEPTKDAAERELAEETGYHAKEIEFLISIRTTVAFCNEKIDSYVAKGLTPGHQNLDEDEFVDVKAYTVEELLAKIYAGEIEDSKTIIAILAYKDKYINH